MKLPSFLQNAEVSFADLDPSVAATVNDEIFSISCLDLWTRLYPGPGTHHPTQAIQQLGYAIGWHLVARRAQHEEFILSTNEQYLLSRERHTLLRHYLELTQPSPKDELPPGPITHNLAALSTEDRRALTQGRECPAFQARVGSEPVPATEVMEHILPHERWRLAEDGLESGVLLRRALQEVAKEKAAWAAAREESSVLLEVLRRLEEQAIFKAYMRKRRLGPPGAAMPLRPEDLDEISEDEARACYDFNLKYFRRATQVEAQRIVVHDQEAAQKLLARAEKGEDFAALARENSIAPEATEGGSLGTLQRGKPETLDPWTLYLIFQHLQRHPESVFFGPLCVGRDGDWQIFALKQVEFEEVSFEGAQDLLRRRLMRQKLRQRGMTMLSELLASSTVVLNRKWIEGPRADDRINPNPTMSNDQ